MEDFPIDSSTADKRYWRRQCSVYKSTSMVLAVAYGGLTNRCLDCWMWILETPMQRL